MARLRPAPASARSMAYRWIRRYREEGLAGLAGCEAVGPPEPRGGAGGRSSASCACVAAARWPGRSRSK